MSSNFLYPFFFSIYCTNFPVPRRVTSVAVHLFTLYILVYIPLPTSARFIPSFLDILTRFSCVVRHIPLLQDTVCSISVLRMSYSAFPLRCSGPSSHGCCYRYIWKKNVLSTISLAVIILVCISYDGMNLSDRS